MSYQNGYPGPQQYGGYPPPPPPPRRRGGLVVLILGVCALLAGVVVAVVQFTGDGDTDRATDDPTMPPVTTSWTAPPADASSPTQSSDCVQCFSGVTLAGYLGGLKAQGFVCQPIGKNKNWLGCDKGDEVVVNIRADFGDPTRLGSVSVATFDGGPGDNPQGKGRVIASMRRWVPLIIDPVLTDGEERRQVSGWILQNFTTCGSAETKVAGYAIGCSKPTQTTVEDKKGNASTSWSTSAIVYGRES